MWALFKYLSWINIAYMIALEKKCGNRCIVKGWQKFDVCCKLFNRTLNQCDRYKLQEILWSKSGYVHQAPSGLL